jgi:transposase
VRVDTRGHLRRALVHAADVSESEGGQRLLQRAEGPFTRIQKLWVDQGDTARFVDWVGRHLGGTVEVTTRPPEATGFAVSPKRWVVERTLAWLTRNRRLSKDDEYWEVYSAAYLYLASIRLLTTRVTCATS